jgi:D-3-phosphoglycerate dehydrogenase / 2-oxoglutarate reductase
MHVVIPDDYQDCVRHLDCFEKLKDHQVTIYHDTVKGLDELVKRFYSADAIVLTRERTSITAELLSQLPNLKLVSQTGKINTHVDVRACQAAGVMVCDGSGSGACTVELNMLLILASLRNLVAENKRLHDGLWQGSLGHQLNGKTVGILGFGRLGSQVSHLVKAFGAKPLVWGRESTLQKAQKEGFEVALSREVFFSTCDILTLQLRLTPQTLHIVTAQDLALMKPSATLVNVSRAELIETGALEAALKRGRPGFAAVDVYEEEPVLGANHPLLKLPNCLCTPHLGFVEKDNYELYFGTAFDNINAFDSGHPVRIVEPQ